MRLRVVLERVEKKETGEQWPKWRKCLSVEGRYIIKYELELSATNTEIKMFANDKSTIPVVMSTKLKSKYTLDIEVKGCQTI